ncbi:glycosyltransferase family 39 protein [Patescibacteria group bacterium]|nr:glycosyltransferase family 39 protein [Patescibacteria group bacterium]
MQSRISLTSSGQRDTLSLRWFLLAAIFAISFFLRVQNLSYNSPFIDEAIYVVLGQKVLNGTWQAENPFAWVGGMPLFYPSFSALSYRVSGILGPRFLNVLLGSASVLLFSIAVSQLRLFGKTRFNQAVGLLSALFLGISSVSIWLSRLAIYDMLSFFLLILGIVFLQRATYEKQENLYLLASGSFGLSFLAKYTALMIIPSLLGLTLLYILRFQKKQLVWFVYYVLFVLGLVSVVYGGAFGKEVFEFFTGNVMEADVPLGLLLNDFFQYTGLWYLLAVFGAILLFIQGKAQGFILLLFSFLPLVFHLLTQNTAVLVQNTLYSTMFLFPLVASFLIMVFHHHRWLGGALVFFLFMGLFVWSRNQWLDLERIWANSDQAMAFLRENASTNEPILAESDDVAVLALDGKVSGELITGPFVFSNAFGEGLPAYQKAVSEGYFGLVELESQDSALATAVADGLEKNYILVYQDPPFRIYRRR